MNSWSAMGRMNSDPRQFEVGEKTKVLFWISVPRKKDRTKYDSFQCQAWGPTGDFVMRNFHKGDGIALTGSWETYLKKETSDTVTYVNVDNVYFTGYKKKEENYDAPIEDIQDLPFL